MSTLKERIEKLLRSLGPTADDVAESLRRRRIIGVREEGCRCPIANLLRAEFDEAREENGAVWALDADPQLGEWFVCASFISTPVGRIDHLPESVREFISVFDDGRRAVDEEGFPWYQRPFEDLEAARAEQ